MRLTQDQLAAIDHHLRQENGLLNEDLISELTDHYVAGIEDCLTQGMAFDAALGRIYAGFGGRRGLLMMQEDFAYTQFQRVNRNFRSVLLTYVKSPKLVLSLMVFAVFYNWVSADPMHERYKVIAGGLYALAFSVFIVTSFGFMKNKLRNWNKPNVINNRFILTILGLVILNFGVVYMLAAGPEAWLPASIYEQHRISFTALALTGSVIYGLAVIEFIRESILKQRTT